MKLHKVPNNTKIRLKPKPVDEDGTIHPPAHREFEKEEILDFKHIDGMYSLCYDNKGNPVHLVSWAEVEIVDE